jgi:hypothetical protein
VLAFLVAAPFVCLSIAYLLGMWPWELYMLAYLQPLPPPPHVVTNQTEL